MKARFCSKSIQPCTKIYHLHSQKQRTRLDIVFPECESSDDISENSPASARNSLTLVPHKRLAIFGRSPLLTGLANDLKSKIPAALFNKAARQVKLTPPVTRLKPFAFKKCLDFFEVFQFSCYSIEFVQYPGTVLAVCQISSLRCFHCFHPAIVCGSVRLAF